MDTQIPTITGTASLDDIASEYGKLVSSVCRRMIRDEEVAKEAAQQVWLEIVKSFPSFRGESKVSTWIYAITRRVAMNHSRKENLYSARHLLDYARGEEFDPAGRTDLDKELWVKEMCDKCVTASLHCFDHEARLAIVFKDIAELSYEEIAKVLEKEEAAVRQMVSRNRRKLQFFMKGLCILRNPAGNCRCRMKKWVLEVDLPREYEKMRNVVRHVNFYKQSEMVLPQKDFWKNLL
jgi:RNA polymerase sigma factor (sigma-70 family)